MVGFAVAITVEISTGKGLLEVPTTPVLPIFVSGLPSFYVKTCFFFQFGPLQNFGLTTPLPTVALAVTALVGVLTAIFIFQSASKSS